MRLAFKYRIYPSAPQSVFLDGELREAASLYNAALEERIGAWKIRRKSIDYYDQANQLKAMRVDGCLTLANFSCCQDVLRRVDKTFKAFFARVKRGVTPGFPRYRSSRRYDSITFPSYGVAAGCSTPANCACRARGTSRSNCTGPSKALSRRLRLNARRAAGSQSSAWNARPRLLRPRPPKREST